jgi:hypothetical protein
MPPRLSIIAFKLSLTRDRLNFLSSSAPSVALPRASPAAALARLPLDPLGFDRVRAPALDMRVTARGRAGVVGFAVMAELVTVLLLAPEFELLVRRFTRGRTPDRRGSKVVAPLPPGEPRPLDGNPSPGAELDLVIEDRGGDVTVAAGGSRAVRGSSSEYSSSAFEMVRFLGGFPMATC